MFPLDFGDWFRQYVCGRAALSRGDHEAASSGTGPDDRTGTAPTAGGPPPVETDGGVVGNGEGVPAGTRDAGGGDSVAADVLLAHLESPAFVLGPDGRITAWNDAVAATSGVDRDRAVGRDDAGALFYPDREDAETLAEQVLSAPEGAADRHSRVERVDGPARYGHEEWLCDATGADRYFEHRASPLYDDGDLVGVLQYAGERTGAMRRQEAVAHFVFELNRTVSSLNDGQLDARVEFEGERDAVDDGLLAVEQHVNEMADQFESHVARVREETEQLAAASERAVAAVGDITANIDDQNALLEEGVDEMQTFSATMEEVASTADEVDAAAARAREAATDGVEAGTDAREATEEVIDIGEDLVESVSGLEDRMDDIEAVTEVIAGVAKETNMLALNANIEAARAGEAGDGFAVVAEEVKELADETQQHTEEITQSIVQLRAQTDETVAAVTDSHDRIGSASEQIETALAAFEDIDAAVEHVADGIAEVSRATDDQAATVEQLTATLENAREFAGETETAARRVVDATDSQADAVEDLERRVRELQN